jgi:hypothetical protein
MTGCLHTRHNKRISPSTSWPPFPPLIPSVFLRRMTTGRHRQFLDCRIEFHPQARLRPAFIAATRLVQVNSGDTASVAVKFGKHIRAIRGLNEDHNMTLVGKVMAEIEEDVRRQILRSCPTLLHHISSQVTFRLV